ncbi:MAG TPA: DUF1836 domain-containing protein [Bacillota bacterium]|nr:DUF1836 domain-containing protein [Bacillota bacterium]HOG52756.1 DUF1836 domain-containing protein [Bacillota bacterium]
MKERCRLIKDWIEGLGTSQLAEWDQLPDIGLYMDQVVTILERQSGQYLQGEDVKAITPSMINNYVKDGIIKRPVMKKYGREHLADLLILNSAKQVLPISDIAVLLRHMEDEVSTGEKYSYYRALQQEACEGVAARMRQALDNVGTECDDRQLFIFASRLVLEANLLTSAAKMLLRDVMRPSNGAKERKAPDSKKRKGK